MFALICARNVWMFAHWAFAHDKLTVANLCVKSNSMWTNFADNGKIHTRMYNVCTLYTTAVGVILARQLACFRCVFCSLRSHGTRFAYGRLRAQALSQPCLVMGRAKVEQWYMSDCSYVVCWTWARALAERLFDFNLLCLQRMAQLSVLCLRRK